MSAVDVAIAKLQEQDQRLAKAEESGEVAEMLSKSHSNDMIEKAEKLLDRCERYVDMTRQQLEDIASIVGAHAREHAMTYEDMIRIQNLLRKVYNRSTRIQAKYLGNPGFNERPAYMNLPLDKLA